MERSRQQQPKQDGGQHRSKLGRGRGQSSLEMTAALIMVLLLLVAAVRIFAWLNRRIIYRQEDYEATRIEAGSMPHEDVAFTEGNVSATDSILGGVEVDESARPEINLFN